MLKSRPSHRNSFRRLILETLQDRRLMAADVAMPLPAFVAGGMGEGESALQSQATANSKLSHFKSEAETVAALKQMAVEQWSGMFGVTAYQPGYWFLGQQLVGSVGRDHDLSLNMVRVSDAGDFVSSAVNVQTQGNVQTLGVDEADNEVFSDDGFVFVFRDQSIRVIDINDPKNLKEVSRIDLPGMTARMHLLGNKLVVVSQGYDSQAVMSTSHSYFYTQVRFYDVTAKDAPVSAGSYNIEGSTLSSRIVNGKLILVQDRQDAIPPLQMINEQPGNPAFDALWISRYETKQEYLDRITPILLSNVLLTYQEVGQDGKWISEGVLGDWRDIADAGGKHLTSIVTIDLNAKSPKLDSMESILGEAVANTYVTDKSVYLTFSPSDNVTRIVHLDLGNGIVKANKTNTARPVGIVADAYGDVEGTIRDSRFLDEHNGYLRVVTSVDGSRSGGRIRNAANIYVMKSVDGELATVGSLLDISPGDQAYGAEFDGDRALITTGFVDPIWNRPIDPLHGIDFSDPTNPKELSEVVIPGITNYVQWVDSTHLLGIGMVESQSQWFSQVSLYDVKDLAAPKTLDVWQGTSPIEPNFFAPSNALDIHYDAQSKTLTIPQAPSPFLVRNRGWNWSGALIDQIMPIWNPEGVQNSATTDVLVFTVDLDASDPLSLRTQVGDGSGMGRAVVVGDSLVAVTNMYLSTYAMDAPTKTVDRILLSNPLRPDNAYLVDGTSKTILNVLDNDSRLVGYTITAIKRYDNNASRVGTVKILPDQTLEYTAPSLGDGENSWWDNFNYEVTTTDGSKFETQVSLYGTRPYIQSSIGSASITLRAVDANNNPITSTATGDEFWVEVLVQDGRSNPQGVFSAHVDIGFDTKSFEIVGDAEHTGFYTNGVSGEKTAGGWKNLGGFSNSPTPIGSGAQTLVRFKLRATSDAALDMHISASNAIGSEITVYGIDSPVSSDNVYFGALNLPQRTTATASIGLKAYDVSNNPITATAKGDEFWVEVTLQDGRSNGQGVYSAYVDLGFDTSAFEIVGNAESLGGFTNKVTGEKTSSGWKNLGGFRDSTTPSGSGIQSLVRFKLRAKQDAALDMTVTPSDRLGSELTLYGVDSIIPISKITSGSLKLSKKSMDLDVNADGILSPVDSLIVINRLNRDGVDGKTISAASSDKLDVNQDGIISLLDVLIVINQINAENQASVQTVVPMMNTIESNDLNKKK